MTQKPCIAPGIFRQRLLVEAYYEGTITKDSLGKILVNLADHLGLRIYADSIVYLRESGMGKTETRGLMPSIDSKVF